jgi:hypothetical protein
MRGAKLSPDPLGPILEIDYPAHPLIALATCTRLHEAQAVLQHAAGAPKIADPGKNAIADVVDLAGARTEVFSEQLSHQPGIAGDLELRETGVRREYLEAH